MITFEELKQGKCTCIIENTKTGKTREAEGSMKILSTGVPVVYVIFRDYEKIIGYRQ